MILSQRLYETSTDNLAKKTRRQRPEVNAAMLPRVLHYLKREPSQAKNIKAFQLILVNLKWVIRRERESAKDEKRSSDFTLTSYLHLRHRHSKNPVNMFPTRLPIFGEW